MAPKRFATSVIGIWIILVVVVVAMAWQVTPALAGFTPTPPPPTVPPPTATSIPPTATSIPPTQRPPPATSIPPTATSIKATAKSIPPTKTPVVLLPVTGGQASDLSNSGSVVELLAGVMILLLVAISLVVRHSAGTRTEK